MMVRIAELEVDSRYLEDYTSILRKEAAASVRLEPGVVCIFPMAEQGEPTRIRLLEIYVDREAYERTCSRHTSANTRRARCQ